MVYAWRPIGIGSPGIDSSSNLSIRNENLLRMKSMGLPNGWPQLKHDPTFISSEVVILNPHSECDIAGR